MAPAQLNIQSLSRETSARASMTSLDGGVFSDATALQGPWLSEVTSTAGPNNSSRAFQTSSLQPDGFSATGGIQMTASQLPSMTFSAFRGASLVDVTFAVALPTQIELDSILSSGFDGSANIYTQLSRVSPAPSLLLNHWFNPFAQNSVGAFDGVLTPGVYRLVTRASLEAVGLRPQSPLQVQCDYSVTLAVIPSCGTSDFNNDGDSGTDADIEAFFACLAGSCCPTCFSGGSDFNADGDYGTDADIESFFRVLGGGSC